MAHEWDAALFWPKAFSHTHGRGKHWRGGATQGQAEVELTEVLFLNIYMNRPKRPTTYDCTYFKLYHMRLWAVLNKFFLYGWLWTMNAGLPPWPLRALTTARRYRAHQWRASSLVSTPGTTQADASMDEGTIKTQNPKCRFYWRLTEFLDWRVEIQPVMLIFSTPLVNCSCPSAFSLTSPTPTHLPKLTYSINRQCVAVGWGVLSCVVDHILQEFNTLFLTRFRTYKIATPS